MHLTIQKILRWISNVQTKLIAILSQKTLKPTENFQKVVNNFFSVSMVNMCHNSMYLTNYKSYRWSRSVQTTFISILYQKRLKPTNNCLEALKVKSFVSVSMVKMSYNPKHLTNHKSQRWSKSILNNIYTHFLPKGDKTTKKLI